MVFGISASTLAIALLPRAGAVGWGLV